ncbi:NADH-quinone oxidoreductase subunit C [Cytobacillus oceanisediminis]|uniref:NADH-quinone oxidoreductase subunit C n=1 Tax=Cytobacillus oceanisediminis TaxID=665099 RepID=UPI001D1455B9|nr:NADH-quinone oxidoreductase subunit C [Cytobacillus oceanisediminis]MCC3648322.1 NADH-quinone oxidoreductase subunit C [Cytobacillus oceanisediminis]
MSGEKDLEQLKKEAAAKAKAAALAKMKAKEQGETKEETPAEDMDLAKQKAAAAAKAKAAALAKMKAKEQGETKEETPAEDMDLAKQKAAAAAKAKAAAAAKAKAAAQAKQAGGDDEKAKAIAAAKAKAAAAAKAKAAAQAKQAGGEDEKAKAIAAAKAKAAAAAKAKLAAAGKADGAADDEKAKAIAAAKAKAAAAAAAKAKAAGSKADTEPAAEKAPSVNQPYLDKYVKVIEENLGSDVLEEYYINNLSKEVPTLVARAESYFKLAEFLKYNEQLGFDYLSELHGTDFETHMEVYAHLYSYKKRQSVALKVKIDRDEPVIDSLQPLWAGANWPECETYDLLGIKFKGHPNLYRIMLGEDWIGHPLRKDYEPYDVEV